MRVYDGGKPAQSRFGVVIVNIRRNFYDPRIFGDSTIDTSVLEVAGKGDLVTQLQATDDDRQVCLSMCTVKPVLSDHPFR